MSYEKTISIEDIAYLLALVCIAEQADEDIPKPFGLKPLHREIETSLFIDRDTFILEAIFLSCFAVDYGTTSVLGQYNPDRDKILDVSRYYIMGGLGYDLADKFSNALNERLAIYTIAYHHINNKEAKAMGMTTMEYSVFLIGATFSKLNEGRTTDPELTIKAGLHFCVIMDAVTKFLRSITIVRRGNSNALYRQQDHLPKNSVEDHFIDFVGAELKKDIDYLVGLGIKLEKGKLAAKTGGVGWAGYEAFTGHWLSAIVVGGISLFVGGLTDGYKRIQLMKIKQKWMERFSDLSEEQLAYLAEGLQRKYPLLLRGLQNMLEAGEGQ